MVGRRGDGEGDGLLARQQLPAAGARRRGDHRADEEEQPGRGSQQDRATSDLIPRVERAGHHDGDATTGQHAAPTTARLRAGPRRAATRSATRRGDLADRPGRAPDGRPWAARRLRARAAPARRSRQHLAVQPLALGAGQLAGRRSARDLAAAQHDGLVARAARRASTRWVETRTAAPAGPLGSRPARGWRRRRAGRRRRTARRAAARAGAWNAASTTDIRRPMPCEKPAVTRSATSARSKRSSRSCARRSQPVSPRSRAASCRCSQGVDRGHEAADVRAVAGEVLDRLRVRRGRRRRATRTWPAVAGTTPASTRRVVDLPAPLRPTSATEPPGEHVEVDPADGVDRAEPHDQVPHLDRARPATSLTSRRVTAHSVIGSSASTGPAGVAYAYRPPPGGRTPS